MSECLNTEMHIPDVDIIASEQENSVSVAAQAIGRNRVEEFVNGQSVSRTVLVPVVDCGREFNL